MIIKKKIWPEFFDLVSSGKKKFELRLNDFQCSEGDILVLEEWNPKTKSYTGRKTEKKVSSVSKFKMADLTKFWAKEQIDNCGIQIISLKD